MLALIVGSVNIPRMLGIIKNERVVNGEVLEKHCHDHGSARVSFNVNNITFYGKMHFGNDCNEAIVGSIIKIYYDSTDPNKSSALDPVDVLYKEILMVAIMAISFPLFIILCGIRLEELSLKT